MGEQPSMVVRISGNIDNLRKSMTDGKVLIDGVAVSIEKVRKPTDSLHQSFQKFDSVLASVGVNLGTEVRAMGELSQASGKGAASLGGFEKAGLAVGAMMAGWKIGRMAAEFFNLDEKIGNATAKLLGWGDVAALSAANKMDTLAKATAIAGKEITNLDEAIAILSKNAADHAAMVQAAQRDSAVSLVEVEKFRASSAEYLAGVEERALKRQKETLEQISRMTEAVNHLKLAQGNYAEVLALFDQALVDNIRHYQELGLSIQDTATLLGVSEDKVELVTLALETQSQALKKTETDWDALRAAQAQACDEMVAKAQAAAAAQQAAFEKAVDAIIKSQQRMSAGGQRTYDLSTKEGMEEFKKLNPAAHVSGDIPPGYFDTHTLADAIRDGYIDLYAGYRTGSRRPVGPRGFATGVDNFEGGAAIVGERGPELVTLPPGSGVIPNHELGGALGGVTIVINGSVLSDDEKIAAAVGRALGKRLRSRGVRQSVRA